MDWQRDPGVTAARQGKRADDATALAVSHHDRQVAHLLAARHALAQAQTVRAVKQIRDAAAAAEIYAIRQKLSDDAIGLAHALKTEALIKLGALLEAIPKAKGGAAPGVGRRGKNAVPHGNRIPTLAELGIDKKTSMEAQQLVSLPTEMQRAIAARHTTLKHAIKEHVQHRRTCPRARHLLRRPQATC